MRSTYVHVVTLSMSLRLQAALNVKFQTILFARGDFRLPASKMLFWF